MTVVARFEADAGGANSVIAPSSTLLALSGTMSEGSSVHSIQGPRRHRVCFFDLFSGQRNQVCQVESRYTVPEVEVLFSLLIIIIIII